MKEYVITINGEEIRRVSHQELEENAEKYGNHHAKELARQRKMRIKIKRAEKFTNILRWLKPF